MFEKVLIANRGEIACRIIRTLDRLGVASVAVYSEADRYAPHTRLAGEAYLLGPAPVAESYLQQARILEVAKASGAQAIHPGYGLLSENPDFARAVEAAGLVFLGPTSESMEAFALKHSARELAERAEVPLVPGSGLLVSREEACEEAARIRYPVMLKSTAGGGGIGMRLCENEEELLEAYDSVRRLGEANFGNASLFLEKFIRRARHVEAQVFGDGEGGVLVLGERDCSLQRRNQKVVEECPAPGLSDALREALHESARKLASAVRYRSAGTVEFIYDVDEEAYYFLEVNTRLQVEHPVTECVYGVDLVEWMIRLGAGERDFLPATLPAANGHAVEVRVYAENPARNFQPSAGLLQQVELPKDVRVDSWIEPGLEVSHHYDPLLAKLIVHEADRSTALASMQQALEQTHISGLDTNVDYLGRVLEQDSVRAARHVTATLGELDFEQRLVEVLASGVQTTVQDWPGRLGYWDVGVPPSGPMDDLSFRIGNRLLGNPQGAPGLECIVEGPRLKFQQACRVCLAGATAQARLDGQSVSAWEVLEVPAGGLLEVGRITDGARVYVLVEGGFVTAPYLGSQSTFTLGQFGGHCGRPLLTGDYLRFAEPTAGNSPAATGLALPAFSDRWEIGVLYGPHGAPDFFEADYIETFFQSDFEVHYNSSRTGVRLIGPTPHWARHDGGEAGLHPSNIHDCAYAVGSIDFTGDMPIILGPDGPSLGGFVCPAVILRSELWKIGQLKAGDRVRFVRRSVREASEQDALLQQALQHGEPEALARLLKSLPESESALQLPAILEQVGEDGQDDALTYRRSGEQNILVEFGSMQLDLGLRFRAHVLREAILAEPPRGLIDLTPGIRSLQVHFDHHQTSATEVLAYLKEKQRELPDITQQKVPTRTVHLPLSWDDEATQLAIQKYEQSVRKDAPWCPSNIEFIRRINGLASIEEVRRIVFDASYLVMGLGDVYLGAPVATPVDPRHRLVTTKYNPARTWTPENAVGIGGAYLCIYGMEGPGGYQFVGRTLPIWNRFRSGGAFEEGKPWLLRFFDQIRFFPVSAEELLEQREDFLRERYAIRIEEAQFDFADYQAFLEREQESITAFKYKQQDAFEAERERWRATGQDIISPVEPEPPAEEGQVEVPEGCELLESHVHGSVWKLLVEEGQSFEAGETLAVLESMKMEIELNAATSGSVRSLLRSEGDAISPGQPLLLLEAGSPS